MEVRLSPTLPHSAPLCEVLPPPQLNFIVSSQAGWGEVLNETENLA